MATKEKAKSYVETKVVLALLRKHGMRVKEQAAWYQAKGTEGRRLYVRLGKTCGQMDVSGFTMPSGCPGVVDLGKEAYGQVKQRVDFFRPEEEVLATIQLLAMEATSKPASKATPKKVVKAGRKTTGKKAPAPQPSA